MSENVSAPLTTKVESVALTNNGGFLAKPKVVHPADLMGAVIKQLKEVSRIAEAFGNNSPDESSKQYTEGVKLAAQNCENALLIPSYVKGLRPK